jgi:hypothetical protein
MSVGLSTVPEPVREIASIALANRLAEAASVIVVHPPRMASLEAHSLEPTTSVRLLDAYVFQNAVLLKALLEGREVGESVAGVLICSQTGAQVTDHETPPRTQSGVRSTNHRCRVLAFGNTRTLLLGCTPLMCYGVTP